MLKMYFVGAPIFNMNYAFLSISNRKILELIARESGWQPLDFLVAGESIEWMIWLGKVSWAFVILVETGLIGMILRPIVKLMFNAQYYFCLTLSRKKKKGISPRKNGNVEEDDLEDRDAQAII
jgi:hypothetical protein